MDFLKQHFVSLDLVTFAGGNVGEVELDEVGHHVAGLPQPPVQRVEAAAQIHDLAFVSGFLEKQKSK